LLKTAGSSAAVAELLASLPAVVASPSGNGSAPIAAASPAPVAAPAAPAPVAASAPVAPKPAAAPVASSPAGTTAGADDEPLVLEAYIDSARCTTCNECTNLNKKMFAYNADKQAYVKDVSAGTFQQLVIAAERCPVSIIHPGTPHNAKEKDLAKWMKRAEKFN
jgi:pyruvate-ferredoxin/flavodoxin oxidoreductase